mmetsp:Transcript_37662/g.85534  ORF Transcript_37662/g.85534 Transcript_37662/m.85534 type:complete len:211 (+) Transcript_37662:859-1491(+)
MAQHPWFISNRRQGTAAHDQVAPRRRARLGPPQLLLLGRGRLRLSSSPSAVLEVEPGPPAAPAPSTAADMRASSAAPTQGFSPGVEVTRNANATHQMTPVPPKTRNRDGHHQSAKPQQSSAMTVPRNCPLVMSAAAVERSAIGTHSEASACRHGRRSPSPKPMVTRASMSSVRDVDAMGGVAKVAADHVATAKSRTGFGPTCSARKPPIT